MENVIDPASNFEFQILLNFQQMGKLSTTTNKNDLTVSFLARLFNCASAMTLKQSLFFLAVGVLFQASFIQAASLQNAEQLNR